MSLMALSCLAAGSGTKIVAESAVVGRVAILIVVASEEADTAADAVAAAASKDNFAEAAVVDSVTTALVEWWDIVVELV